MGPGVHRRGYIGERRCGVAVFSWARASTLDVTLRMRADQRIYFISDLHLGDGGRSDSFLGKDRELLALLERVRNEDAHLVIVGDFIDFHQAWSMSRVLKAHGRVFGELSRHAASHGVTYIWGNHDYDINLFRELLRFDVCSTLLIGDDILVQHGYQFDPHIGTNLEGTHIATMVHHLVERIFHTWIRLPLEAFYNKATRLALGLFYVCASLTEAAARLGRRLGAREPLEGLRLFFRYWALNQMGDPGMLIAGVKAALPELPYRFIVAGHSHMPGLVEVAPGRTYVNTGSWTFGAAQYALWDGSRFSVHDWISGKTYGDAAYLPAVRGELDEATIFEWWRENHLGWLRFRAGEEGRWRWSPPVAPARGPR